MNYGHIRVKSTRKNLVYDVCLSYLNLELMVLQCQQFDDFLD